MKGQEEKKESVLGTIKKYQVEDKQKPKESKEKPKRNGEINVCRCGLWTAPALFLFMNDY